MFQLMENPTIWWPVQINVPLDGGKSSSHEIQIKFEILEVDEYERLANLNEQALFVRVIKGWKDIETPQGNVFEFSDQHLIEFLKKSFVRASIFSGYLQAARGAAVKN